MMYIALLRGINVGGTNIIKMVDLRAALESAGFENVRTYIQSGNVVFDCKSTKTGTLEKKIEKILEKEFGYKGFVVVISASTLEKIIKEAPNGFGSKPEKYRYDVIFLKAPMTSKKAIEDVPTREGVDEKYAGANVLYFSRLIKEAGKSQLSKIISLPVYKNMTIRNWNTTTTLLTL